MSGRSKPSWTPCYQNDPKADQPYQQTHYQSTTLTSKCRQLRTPAEHRRLKSGPPLMRGLDIHKESPVSVGFIRSYLTANKLFTVNPRAITGPSKMSLPLEAKNMPALIIKPRLILVTHTDDLGWYITSNQQGQMFVQNLIRIVSKPNVTPGQILYCTTDSIPVDLMFQENVSINTQVWNRLSHRNDCRQRGVI